MRTILLEILKIAEKSVDWISKNLGRIKTIGIILVVVIFIVNNGCNQSARRKLIEKITGVNIENDILHNDIKKRDTMIMIKELRIAALEDSLKDSEKSYQLLKSQYRHLQGDYSDLADSLLKIPTDSSYDFLQHTAYPYPGELEYPFNEPQVKSIHLTFLEKISLEGMNANLVQQVAGCENQLALKDDIAEEVEGEMMLMKENRSSLEEIVDNKDEIIKFQDKQIDKSGKRKGFWKVTSGVLGVIVLILAL